jgi:uncharacterized protein YlxP (DUF503 family)
MLQCIIEIPESSSIKDKRRIVHSLREKLRRTFNISAAEVDLADSLGFAHIGGALVSNSREFGEKVLQKAVLMIEKEVPGCLQDVQIHSESF